jgi:hypothetical protein
MEISYVMRQKLLQKHPFHLAVFPLEIRRSISAKLRNPKSAVLERHEHDQVVVAENIGFALFAPERF